jgi:hypothetical protein
MNRKNPGQISLRIFLLILIFSFHATPIHAQNEIQDSVVIKRIQYINNSLEHDRLNTQRWWYGWLGAYSAATIGQGAVYFSGNEKSTRQDMALGAATTLLGAVGQFVSPVILGKETEKLNSFPANTVDERQKKLAVAEQLLKECGNREKLARSWKYHALTGAVNIGGGLVTWLGFKRNIGAGVGYFALNTVITEAQIWTQPMLAKRNYKKYQQKYLLNENDFAEVSDVTWSIGAYPGGMGIRVAF